MQSWEDNLAFSLSKTPTPVKRNKMKYACITTHISIDVCKKNKHAYEHSPCKAAHGPGVAAPPSVENWMPAHLLILFHQLVYNKHFLGETPSWRLRCLWFGTTIDLVETQVSPTCHPHTPMDICFLVPLRAALWMRLQAFATITSNPWLQTSRLPALPSTLLSFLLFPVASLSPSASAYVILGKLFHFSVLQFSPHVKWG